MYKQLIALAVILTCSVYGSDSAPVKAQKLFEDFVSGKFIQPSSPVVMGWIMEGPDGKMISRTILNHQADQVALLGIDAFPVILEKLEHKDMHVRYIAATALRKISGEDPLWYTFGIPGEKFNGNSSWSDHAKKTWISWYQQQIKKSESGRREILTPAPHTTGHTDP